MGEQGEDFAPIGVEPEYHRPMVNSEGAPGEVAAAPSTRSDSRMKRAAVTVVASAALLVGARLRLPQIDPYSFREVVGYGLNLSPLALGFLPLIIGFVLVEFVAAVMPRWRALRDGGFAERSRLAKAAWALGFAVALLQGWGTANFLSSMLDLHGDPLVSPDLLPRLSVAGTLALGTLALGALAVVVSRKGLGNGFALLFAVWGAEALGWWGFRVLLGEAAPWSDVSLLVILALVVILPLVFTHRAQGQGGERAHFPLLTCSVVVLQLPAGVIELAYIAGGLLAVEPARKLEAWLGGDARQLFWAALVVLLAVPLARLFFPRNAVEATWARAVGAGAAAADVGRSLDSAHRWSIALVAVGGALPLIAAELGAAYVPSYELLVDLAVLVAVVADVRSEWRARGAGSAMVAVRPLHRAYAVEPVLRALAAAGIGGFARTRHFRALFHVFAPYAPIEILVPPARAAEADAICARVVVGSERP